MIKHIEKAKACIKITGEPIFFFISSTTGKLKESLYLLNFQEF